MLKGSPMTFVDRETESRNKPKWNENHLCLLFQLKKYVQLNVQLTTKNWSQGIPQFNYQDQD